MLLLQFGGQEWWFIYKKRRKVDARSGRIGSPVFLRMLSGPEMNCGTLQSLCNPIVVCLVSCNFCQVHCGFNSQRDMIWICKTEVGEAEDVFLP